MVCIDFSGAGDDGEGSGGIPEIVSRINAELRNRQKATGVEHYVKNIIIDYLGSMVQSANPGERADVLTHQTASTVKYLAKSVSRKFNCHIWVLQQLSGEANSKMSPTANINHTDGQNCKSVAENADFALTMGHLTLDSVGQIACTKHRRAAANLPKVIQVQGEFNRVITPDNYYINSNGRIVDREVGQATASLTEEGSSDSEVAEVGSSVEC
jgi:hypothetical protein